MMNESAAYDKLPAKQSRLCQNTCGIALLYCAAIPCAILLKDRDALPAVFRYQGSVLASPSRTPYTGEKPSNSEIFVMSA